MHIVAFCARKGGTGKSTLALQLAGDLVPRGQEVVLAGISIPRAVCKRGPPAARPDCGRWSRRPMRRTCPRCSTHSGSAAPGGC